MSICGLVSIPVTRWFKCLPASSELLPSESQCEKRQSGAPQRPWQDGGQEGGRRETGRGHCPFFFLVSITPTWQHPGRYGRERVPAEGQEGPARRAGRGGCWKQKEPLCSFPHGSGKTVSFQPTLREKQQLPGLQTDQTGCSKTVR